MNNHKKLTFKISPGGRLSGQFRLPGDKSISHRSIMFGSLAKGTTTITGFLQGQDTLATLQVFRELGVAIEGPHEGRVVIHGVGLNGLKAPSKPLYLGNSGTSIRLLAGLFAGQPFDVELQGDASLTRRPMRRIMDPLSEMGANITSSASGTPPLHIHSVNQLKGITYRLPVASAQVKSSILLAGLYAHGKTCVTEPAPTRDHTERMLQGFGYDVDVEGHTICINGGGQLQATDITVPGDISSAAFFLVGASIAPQSDLVLEHVGVNPTRIGVIEILKMMGADIQLLNKCMVGGEPVADIRVRSSNLKGIKIPPALVPLAIDEFPAIFIAAACAQGTTVLTGAAELRVKESDRIQAMADGLKILGIDANPTEDGIIIEGGSILGGQVQSCGDHRIAMALSMSSLKAKQDIIVQDCDNVSTSFPNYVELAGHAGLRIDMTSD